MSNEEVKFFTEEGILISIRNQALVNKMNALVSIKVIEGAKPENDEHKKKLDEKLIEYKLDLDRFIKLIKVVDQMIIDLDKKPKVIS